MIFVFEFFNLGNLKFKLLLLPEAMFNCYNKLSTFCKNANYINTIIIEYDLQAHENWPFLILI